MNISYQGEIYREDKNGDTQQIFVIIYGCFHKARRGARDSLGGIWGAGPPIEPDEDAYVDIEDCRNAETGEKVELTNDEESDFAAKMLENIIADRDEYED